ncbi:hypothetical protein H2200_003235 [Cladophialophora chaetospira]|uniref:NmrA-like domain-containing protein n=1 Tax=Cladophialophora chaetospira TaxID=386627 RepID=A0AA39CMJ5_9EURO|nr:hypothetical protein H2200_003235 [Cladophialophora chaetospira]
MTPQAIEKVAVVGASGPVGLAIVQALCDADFQVSVLTRSSSTSNTSFPSTVKVIPSDYTNDSLVRAFHSQHAVVSVLNAAAASLQRTIVDAAIASGVRHFLPSEYGVDTSSEAAATVLPALGSKLAVVKYLKSREDKIAWTALVTGCLFDWSFQHPPFGGWSLEGRKAIFYDGGDIPFEATTLAQVGHGVVAVFRHQELVANRYVYINSLTTTQNQVIESLEKAGSGKWAITHTRTDETFQKGMELVQKGGAGRMLGIVNIITAAFYNYGRLNFYSTNVGLWNDRLNLPQEDLDNVTAAIVEDARSSARSGRI